MSAKAPVHSVELTSYESEQVEEIAAWKSAPPNPWSELWKMITLPLASAIEKVTPDQPVAVTIEMSYRAAAVVAGEQDIKLRAGVPDLALLRDRPLEECDGLARQVGAGATVLAVVEGAATGAGGVLTTLLDVPLLFVLGIRTILRIGHCYGYSLDDSGSKEYVLGVLVAAISGSLQIKRDRLDRLREIEELLIEETQEDVLTEELLSFLFQLEIFEEVPGVGAVSGGLLNLGFILRINQTAQRVFQERWLRDNGKVVGIDPAPGHPRQLATGWTGTIGHATYSGCYGFGFVVALPVFTVAALFGPMEDVLTRGIRDSATAARREVDRLRSRSRRRAVPASSDGHPAGKLAPA